MSVDIRETVELALERLIERAGRELESGVCSPDMRERYQALLTFTESPEAMESFWLELLEAQKEQSA